MNQQQQQFSSNPGGMNSMMQSHQMLGLNANYPGNMSYASAGGGMLSADESYQIDDQDFEELEEA